MTMVYRKGDFVDYVDLAAGGPLEVLMPQRWFVLCVHPNCEHAVMRTFRRRNVSAYLPLITRSVALGHYAKRNVTYPLFPGLVLVPDYEVERDGEVQIRDGLLQVDGVIGLLRFGDWIACLSLQDLENIRRIEAIGNTPPSKRKRAFEIGQLVRVTDGPFAAFGGRIERLDSNGRLSVLVDMFKRMVPVEMADNQIEAVMHRTGAATSRQ
jgi:transcriptional antiterminator NusG